MNKKNYDFYFPFLLIFLVLLAYSNSFNGVFIFDDYPVIVDNPRVHGLSPMILYPRILTEYSFRLNYMIAGINPADYHAVNLIIHIISGLLLYGIIRRTLLMPVTGSAWRERSAWFALVVSSIWLIHPLQTESVTYICQRYESMAGLFYFLTLYCFIRGLESLRRKHVWYDFSLLACIIGLGCKDIIVTVPVVVFLYDYVFSGESILEILKSRWKIYLALFMTWGVYACLFLGGWTLQIMDDQSFISDVFPFIYLLNQCEIILYYLRLSIIPYPLCIDYGWKAKETLSPLIIPCIIIIVTGITSLWGLYRKNPLGFIGACFFIILAPTSSIIPLPDLAFEHRMYLPLAGVVVIVVIAGYEGLRRYSRLSLITAFTVCLVITLSSLTYLRNMDYINKKMMWGKVVKRIPFNLRAGNDFAIALSESGKTNDAIYQYNRVLSLIPQGLRLKMDEGLIRINSSIGTDTYEYHYFRAHTNMGLLLYKRLGDVDGAIKHYVLALKVLPFHRNLREKLKHLLRIKGFSEGTLDGEIENLIKRNKSE